MLCSQLKEWSHSLSFRPALELFNQTLSIELLGQINFSTKEVFFKPKLSYDIADDLTVTTGAQIYNGPDDTLYGLMEESNSALFVEVKTSF
jgi:hypothetical protein